MKIEFVQLFERLRAVQFATHSEKRTREVAAAALLFIGGGAGLTSTFLPEIPPTYNIPLVRAIAGFTIVLAALEFLLGNKCPAWRHHIFEGAGTLLIGGAIYATGGGDVSVAAAMASILVILDATIFLGATAMILHATALIAVNVIALTLVPDISSASLFFVIAVLAGSAVVSHRIIRQREAVDSDFVTGLLNQRGFERLLDEQLSRISKVRDGSWPALCRLHTVHSPQGEAGSSLTDEELQEIAQRWQALLPAGSLFGHFGGGRFAFYCSTGSLIECEASVRRLVGQVEKGRGSCAGVAIVEPGDDVSTLSSRAASALSMARRRGAGSIVRHPGAYNGSVQIREALADGQFVLLFQPIVRLGDNQIVGAEALIRWRHPKRGLIDPGDFIADTELTGAIVELGQWVLAEACREAVRWPSVAGRLPYVSVNVSGRELREIGYADNVLRALISSGLRGERLVLEFIETDYDDNSKNVADNLRLLRQMGVRVAIDDFGTGSSNFTRLDRLDADILKIDKSFVAHVKDHRASTPITSAIVAISHVLGLPVVAEGVENREQAAWLRARGCYAAQGYLYSAPVDAAAMLQTFSRSLVDRAMAASISELTASVPNTWLEGASAKSTGNGGLGERVAGGFF